LEKVTLNLEVGLNPVGATIEQRFTLDPNRNSATSVKFKITECEEHKESLHRDYRLIEAVVPADVDLTIETNVNQLLDAAQKIVWSACPAYGCSLCSNKDELDLVNIVATVLQEEKLQIRARSYYSGRGENRVPNWQEFTNYAVQEKQKEERFQERERQQAIVEEKARMQELERQQKIDAAKSMMSANRSVFLEREKQQQSLLRSRNLSNQNFYARDLDKESAKRLIGEYLKHPKPLLEHFGELYAETPLGLEVQRMLAEGYLQCGNTTNLMDSGVRIGPKGQHLIKECRFSPSRNRYSVTFFTHVEVVGSIVEIVTDSGRGTALVRYELQYEELPILQTLRELDPALVNAELTSVMGGFIRFEADDPSTVRKIASIQFKRWDQGWRVGY
jgi:hypothetical protein